MNENRRDAEAERRACRDRRYDQFCWDHTIPTFQYPPDDFRQAVFIRLGEIEQLKQAIENAKDETGEQGD